ncbi:MAG: OmpA family protein [Methylophilaceae bacterium]
MHNNQSSHFRFSWVVASILALILLWMLFTGRGPNNTCCASATEAVGATATTESAIVTEAFSFSATADSFTSGGDGSHVGWITNTDALRSLLAGNVKAEGDDKTVLLSGLVDSEAIKQQKGADAQAFFGSGVTVNNQLMVKTSEPVVTIPPPAAKLYFDTGKINLAADADNSLAPIIAWLKAHPESKAVLAGYHDSRGDVAFNEALAKSRAESVEDALEAAGIDDDRVEKRKPESVDGGVDLAEARRVEVSIE